MKVVKSYYEILTPISDGGHDELAMIEEVGRTCYKSEAKIDSTSSKKFIQNIINRGHEAMLEHSILTVKFTVDRGVSHEIVRHRLASFAQESTRYCNYAGDKFDNQISVIDLASGFQYDLSKENDKAKYDIWVTAMQNAEKAYFRMLELGATPQEARSVLPSSTKTDIQVSMNYREWRHFFKLRVSGTTGSPHPQMKEVAKKLLYELKSKIPIIFDDILIEN